MQASSAALRRGAGLLAVGLSTLGFTGHALASGPAPAGKDVSTFACNGLGTVTLSTPTGPKSVGAAQIIGSTGTLIPTSFVLAITDLTTNTLLKTETVTKGGGHANANQATTTCSATVFQGTFGEIAPPGTPLPPGVSPTDVLQGDAVVTAVIKP